MFPGRKGEVAGDARSKKTRCISLQIRSCEAHSFREYWRLTLSRDLSFTYVQPKDNPMDEQKLQEFLGRALVDLGGAVNAVLMSIGDELGLYKALAKGPQSPAELARNTHTHERCR